MIEMRGLASRYGRYLVVGVAASVLITTIGMPAETQASATRTILNATYARNAEIEATADEIAKIQVTLGTEKVASYGGMWVDPDGNPHLAIAHGDNGLAAAAKTQLSREPVVHEVALTVTELTAIQDAIAADARADGFRLAGATLSSLEQDIVNNRVIVYLVNPTEAQKNAVTGRYGLGVTVMDKTEPAQPTTCYEYNCPSPLKAGLRLFNSAGYDGMSSFVFRYTDGSGYLMSTAGHASTLNESKYHPSGTFRGTVLYDIDGGGAPIDASLFSVPASQAGNKLYDYDGSGGIASITSRELESGAVIGEPICMSALDFWTVCGTLQSTNVDLTWASDQYKANTYARGGDSGSPVFYGNRAHGIVIGNDCDGCAAMYYTPIQRVETYWNNLFTVLTYQP